jgi:predicted ester cyclase
MRGKFSVLLAMCLFLIMALAQGYEETAKVDLKKVADKIAKAYESADATAMANCYAEDAILITSGEVIRGREAIQEHMAGFHRAFPDLKIEFLTILPSGNHIAFEQVVRGTNTGPLLLPEGEIPPTGKKVELKAVWIGRISDDGLIEEDRTYHDTADLMRQLGLME